MKVQAGLQRGDIVSKDDDTPVTVADYACQAIVAWVLQQHCSSRCGPESLCIYLHNQSCCPFVGSAQHSNFWQGREVAVTPSAEWALHACMPSLAAVRREAKLDCQMVLACAGIGLLRAAADVAVGVPYVSCSPHNLPSDYITVLLGDQQPETPHALCRLQLVAEEDSADLRRDGAQQMLSAITALVTQALQAAYPSTVQLSHDDVLDLIDLGDSQAGASGQRWVLDPIDGTRGFEVCSSLLPQHARGAELPTPVHRGDSLHWFARVGVQVSMHAVASRRHTAAC